MKARIEALAARLAALAPKAQLWRAAPLSAYTSFGVGGPADLLLVARDVGSLQRAVTLANECCVACTVLGSGTNVLVSDAGIRGLVLINAARQRELRSDGELVAASGALLGELARWSVVEGWRGLEWAVGIPGTLGGAVVGNAGAYGGCMADIVRWARVLRPDGDTVRLPVEALAYGYRTSLLKQEHALGRRTVVLEVALQLERADADELAAEAADYTARREGNTPKGACAGSMFKRTAHYPAGYLIEKAGLKGLTIGGAQVSPRHANFVMNVGGASATDVRRLIETVQSEVWRRYAHHLNPEVEYLGDWYCDDKGETQR